MSLKTPNPCPHCGTYCRIRTSKPLSDLSREKYYQCTNIECGFEYRAVESIVSTTRDSFAPNPDVKIPKFDRQPPVAAPTG